MPRQARIVQLPASIAFVYQPNHTTGNPHAPDFLALLKTTLAL